MAATGPAVRLCLSWNRLLARLGPMMHAAGKVIFVNPIYSRFDLLRHVDGIYTEFGQDGRSLNASGLWACASRSWLGLTTIRFASPTRTPSSSDICIWASILRAPYPWNNHCIGPEAWVERQYLDYGPLLDALRGKKWVLAAHCVEAAPADIKVNLFAVPGGYARARDVRGKADRRRFASAIFRGSKRPAATSCIRASTRQFLSRQVTTMAYWRSPCR